jgi:hypothetical protein
VFGGVRTTSGVGRVAFSCIFPRLLAPCCVRPRSPSLSLLLVCFHTLYRIELGCTWSVCGDSEGGIGVLHRGGGASRATSK